MRGNQAKKPERYYNVKNNLIKHCFPGIIHLPEADERILTFSDSRSLTNKKKPYKSSKINPYRKDI
jgi:hypothetical protein